MALWPIVDRELRVRSRQGVTYWTRCAVGIATACIALYSVAFAAKSAGGPSAGAAGFAALAWLGFFLSCAACLSTADSISSERREGTLGLLFLTDLHAYEIILGKLTASGLTAFYTITGFIPALALAALCGGVTAGEALRSAAALLNMTLLALAVGLWASTRPHTQSGGRWLALIMVALLILLPWLGAPLMAQALSPYSAFHLADDLRYNPNRLQFWLSIALVQCEAWLFLFGAAANIRRNWRIAERLAASREDKLRQLAFGRISVHAERRALLEQAPIRWVASRTQGRRAWIWGGAFLLL